MLSELDCCILGVIWREGPMSGYGVRAHFAGSTTAAWSSSTGTVYPALRRLRDAGLLEAGEPTGPRRQELLTVTARGEAVLREWLTEVPAPLGSPTADPIRTRVHFLAALEPEERRRTLANYRSATLAALEVLKASAPPRNEVERSEQLGTLGAAMELEARLAWLDLVERELG